MPKKTELSRFKEGIYAHFEYLLVMHHSHTKGLNTKGSAVGSPSSHHLQGEEALKVVVENIEELQRVWSNFFFDWER